MSIKLQFDADALIKTRKNKLKFVLLLEKLL